MTRPGITGIALPPLEKDYAAPSVFQPEGLLREARRQKGIADGSVPAICVLDPDGDLVRALRESGRAERCGVWACYHTDLYRFEQGGTSFGVVGCAVGAPFAVLVAEQLFASGCQLLISVTSAGQIQDNNAPGYFIVIDRALRDEGTSVHYMAPSAFAEADPGLVRLAADALAAAPLTVVQGATWTTDAPYRETESAIAAAKARGVLAVEMEAAALYAFAQARTRPVLCIAHVTNQMAAVEGDFEKGEANGARDVLVLLDAVAKAWEHKAS